MVGERVAAYAFYANIENSKAVQVIDHEVTLTFLSKR